MIREGLLEAAGRRVDAAYAVHVYSADHPFGTWFGRPGTADGGRGRGRRRRCAASAATGRRPTATRDPVPVACEIVLAFQTAVTRQFSVWDPVVLTVGRVAAGTVNNVIPDDAVIEASLRTFSPEHRAKAHEVVTRVAEGIAAAHGLTAEVEDRQRLPGHRQRRRRARVRPGRGGRPVRRRALGRHGRPRGRLRGHVVRARARCPVPTSTSRACAARRPPRRRGQPLAAGGVRRRGRARTSRPRWPRWRCAAPASSPEPAPPAPLGGCGRGHGVAQVPHRRYIG